MSFSSKAWYSWVTWVQSPSPKENWYMLFTSFQNLNLLCSNIFPLYCFSRSELLSGFLHSITAQYSLLSTLVRQFFLRQNILCYFFVFSQTKKNIFVDKRPSFLERLCAMSKLFKGWFTKRNFNMETCFSFYYRLITKELHFSRTSKGQSNTPSRGLKTSCVPDSIN